MSTKVGFIPLICICCCVQGLRADVKLAGIFGDHMVLQQGVTLPIWGWADPGEQVTVAVGNDSATATAAADGSWRVDLKPLKAQAEPIQFTVSGKNKLLLGDVLVGEVWLASGQSNMQFSLKNAANSAAALAQADEPEIRLCPVGNSAELAPLADRGTKWTVCTPASAKSFSAVAYFFAKDLHDNLKVPIGLVGAYVAGTPAQSWTNLQALQSAPELKHYVGALSDARAKAATRESTKDSRAANAGVPTSLYNGMIAPLRPFALRGVIWYQGESNTGNAIEYRSLFPALITGWRTQWGAADMPFLFVQLPGFGRRTPEPMHSDWAMLREAQTMTLKLPRTGMAVTIDLSAPRQLLHPKNKLNVGRRLALVARRVAYGRAIPSEGPVYESMQVDGSAIHVHFTTTGTLVLGSPPTDGEASPATRPSELTGFQIAGSDRKFYRADAKIDGNSVIVSSDQVKEPIAVRYAWDDNPVVDLYDETYLPAVPFRTDNWPE